MAEGCTHPIDYRTEEYAARVRGERRNLVRLAGQVSGVPLLTPLGHL